MSESDVVIRVEGLGKKYALHHEKAERYTALRDVVTRQAREASRFLNPFTLAGQLRKAQIQPAASSEDEFWALKDVSFEICRGQRVGIIGRNGAGKSTLLKILSRITEPTTGRVEIRGRVASLLEVGTGFHPELTGRENIYLNGAILGMTRREIRSKFDEIVDFAEVEKFLDTPVKRYSSGMYVRLAFAVAAHLDPEILVVDEVLAVGDAGFQKRCIGRMQEVTDEGRTVLFVSHNMGAISALCDKGILFSEGKLVAYQSAQKSIETYVKSINILDLKSCFDLSSHPGRANHLKQYLKNVSIKIDSYPTSEIPMGLPFTIEVIIESEETILNPRIGISIEDMTGLRLLALSPSLQDPDAMPPALKKGIIKCFVQSLPLLEGNYSVSLILGDTHTDLDIVNNAINFRISHRDVFKTGQIPGKGHGIAYAFATWKYECGK
jgi:lipopolysaccharide transport system ATP-binding protein